MDLELKVNKHTFIPRPETEILVEKTVEIARYLQSGKSRKALNILDLCSGSGNISISLTKYVSASRICALDISLRAIMAARENAFFNGALGRIAFIQSDMFGALYKNNYFDIIVSNPPYISQKDIDILPDEVKEEPELALFGGKDGLSFYRRIAKEAKEYLASGGYILTEVGYDQAHAVKSLYEENGFTGIEIFKDYCGIERIVKAKNG